MTFGPGTTDLVRKRSARRWLIFALLAVGLYALAVYASVSSLIGNLGQHRKQVSIDAEVVATIPGARMWAVPALLREIEYGTASSKQNSLYALEMLQATYSEVGPGLVAMLDNPDPVIRSVAAAGLGNLGSAAEPAIGALVSRLDDKNGGNDTVQRVWTVRDQAAEALGKIGRSAAAAVPPLRDALGDADFYFRLRAAIALWRITSDAALVVPTLSGLVELPPRPGLDEVRIGAVRALKELGPDAAAAVPALIKALGDKDHPSGAGETVRDEAAIALAAIGPAAKEALPALLVMLDDYSVFSRLDAARAIAVMAPAERRAVWMLIDLLTDGGELPYVHQSAGAATSAFAPSSAQRLGLLLANFRGRDSAAADVLKAGERETLQSMLQDADSHVSVGAAEALWRCSVRTDKVVAALVIGTESEYPRARRWAARASGEPGPEHQSTRLKALERCVADPDALVRVYAAEGIWNLHRDSKAVARLSGVLLDKSNPREVRVRAAYALGRIGPEIGDDAIAGLRRAVADQSEWDVHVAAGGALDAISPPPPAPEPVGPPGAPRAIVVRTLPPR